MPLSTIVAGIDVGGPRKGFHAVALRDGRYLGKHVAANAGEIAAWCREIGARVVGVDAPCRWSTTARARPAERALMADKIHCFFTPTREIAEIHPKNYYAWMLAGAELFRNLETTHRLFDGKPGPVKSRVCFETFPHAVACALAGTIVSAKQKRMVRRGLLRLAGIDTEALTNIDLVDAALCALMAHHLVSGTFKTYGDTESGLIVVYAEASISTSLAQGSL